MKTFSDYNPEIKFNQYQTYAWSSDEDPLDKNYPHFDNSLNRERIKNAINAEMKALGYIISSTAPDLEVDFHIQLERKSVPYHKNQIDQADIKGYKPREIYQFDQGTLIIHLVDVNRKEIIWQGIASKVLEIERIENAEINIQKAVNKVFTKLPL